MPSQYLHSACAVGSLLVIGSYYSTNVHFANKSLRHICNLCFIMYTAFMDIRITIKCTKEERNRWKKGVLKDAPLTFRKKKRITANISTFIRDYLNTTFP